MPMKNSFSNLGISPRKFLIVFVLLFNSFIWFFMNLSIISDSLESIDNSLIVWTTYLVAIIGSALLGAAISSRKNRRTLIYSWLTLGIATSFLLSALTTSISLEYTIIIVALSGVAFGFGMPSVLAYFAEFTIFENRGRVGGVIFFLTNLSIPLFASFLSNDIALNSYATATWRIAGLGAFLVLKPSNELKEPRMTTSFRKVFSRTFVLFLIPWFMFCLIDRFEYQIFLASPLELNTLSLLVEPIIGTVFALVGGLFTDWIGRKKVVVFGFVALGLAYAVLGVATQTVFSQYFYIVIDGIAWGIFFVSFLLVLWGDLSSSTGGHEKYYAVGSIPFFIAYLMQYIVQPYIKSIPILAPEVSFSFASLFLFVAVLPLIYAPETLPEKKIQERQMKRYIEEAKRKVEKKE